MPHDCYTIRQNTVSRCIIDIFTDEPAAFEGLHLINLLPHEAADLLEILNDVDRLKRRLWSMADD
ncbi:hypothetical protein [Aurantimonas coralicida]|uniref:hypothetical protein n=1 Tax=Aurantimonas coralicida TaxID=182270 RepID=UPI001D18B6AA|nr:hypothetical protein [Aurantimonas coralicida]MCC4298143.1 hypothetical protein [Aurantimonas coralicida]